MEKKIGEIKYKSFKDLPADVVKRLKLQINFFHKDIPNPEFTEQQMIAFIHLFNKVNETISQGLPNQLYEMVTRTIDGDLARDNCKYGYIWYGHEGESALKYSLKDFVDTIMKEYKKRKNWTVDEFCDEHLRLKEVK